MDKIVKAISKDGYLFAVSCDITGAVAEAAGLHGLSHVAQAALGRTMAASLMMACLLKNDSKLARVTTQVKGDGPLGGILATADNTGKVKGYVTNPDVVLPLNEAGKLDVGGAVGRNGYLSVIKDIGMKDAYNGVVDLISGEIGEDLAYYFAYSEQVPSAVSLGVLVSPEGKTLAAGGLIVQVLPGAPEEVVKALEEKMPYFASMTDLITEGFTPEIILESLIGPSNTEIVQTLPCKYECGCSRESMMANVMTLGKADLDEIFTGQDTIEVVCHFCDKRYEFGRDDILFMLDDAGEKS